MHPNIATKTDFHDIHPLQALIGQALIRAAWLQSVSAEQRVGAASHAERVESRRTIMRWGRRSG